MNGGDQSLFRPQAVQARQTKWLGPVLLATPLSHTVYAVIALACVVTLGSFAALGEFTRKAQINGWLVPSEGLVRVFAPQAGVVSEIRVREGAQVTRGDPLIVLSAERRTAKLGSTQAEITRLLQSRRESLDNEIRQQELLYAQQRANLERRLAAIDSEISQFTREIEVQSSRASLTADATARLRELERMGFASVSQVQQQQEQELEQKGRLRQLERTRAERQRDRVTLKSELDDLPLKSQTAQSSLARDMQALEQELAESEARREIVITAPQTGTVTAIQAEPGGNATTTTPMLSIVPGGSTLDAQLFAPSRSVGFVRPGQKVLLRYQAYPYQKFGHYTGRVESVSKSALSPGEVPAQLSGLSSLTGTGEPIYRIVVRLDRQDVTAYGKAHLLQPGMQLESDVLLETRKLWEWMLEPLITLTGKL